MWLDRSSKGMKTESEYFCHALMGRGTGDEFITQLLGQQWVAVTRFLFPTESGHVATKPVCSREGEGESVWEQSWESRPLGNSSVLSAPLSWAEQRAALSGSKGKNTGWNNCDDQGGNVPYSDPFLLVSVSTWMQLQQQKSMVALLV